ncbi:hypothetical protein AAE478_007070 [Parahypoxylon ruwenzoriense]
MSSLSEQLQKTRALEAAPTQPRWSQTFHVFYLLEALLQERSGNALTRKRACTECARARERCSRDEPCLRCTTKSLQCVYPDDAAQRASPSLSSYSNSLANESPASPGDEPGQLGEEHLQSTTSRTLSLLPKQGASMTSNLVNEESFNEDDGPLHEFLRTLRSNPLPGPSTSSLPFNKNNPYYHEGQTTNPATLETLDSNSATRNGAGSFKLEPRLKAGRQAPFFEQPPPGSSFNRLRIHDAIGLDDTRFGQYPDLCASSTTATTDHPPFDFHSAAIDSSSSSTTSELQPGAAQRRNTGRSSSLGASPFLPIRVDEGVDLEGLSSAANTVASTAAAGAAQGLMPPPDFGALPSLDWLGGGSGAQRPINLKAYELIASHFKELCLEYGGEASPACSNNISESQRTAHHELFVKLYYEHFKQ